jgi:hypothetical protein
MSELLTRVELHFGRDALNYYIRFGEPRLREDLNGWRAFEYFASGQIFGYVRWEANEYGTQDWRFWVIHAEDTVEPIHRIPGVAPGGEVLLEAAGGACVRKALELIDTIEAQGVDPEEVSSAYYVHVHQRILTRLPIRPYSAIQHKAHLLRKSGVRMTKTGRNVLDNPTTRGDP